MEPVVLVVDMDLQSCRSPKMLCYAYQNSRWTHHPKEALALSRSWRVSWSQPKIRSLSQGVLLARRPVWTASLSLLKRCKCRFSIKVRISSCHSLNQSMGGRELNWK